MKTFLTMALLLAAAVLTVPAPCGSCGVVPVKPVAPLGCRDLVAECVCDAGGQNCKWVWKCVPNR